MAPIDYKQMRKDVEFVMRVEDAIREDPNFVNQFARAIKTKKSDEVYSNGEVSRHVTLFQYQDTQTKTRVFMTHQDAIRRPNFRKV